MTAGPGGAQVRFTPHVWTFAAMAGGIAASFALLPMPSSIAAALVAALAIVIAAVDLELLIIPDAANVALFILGLALTMIESPPGELTTSIGEALLRSLAGGGALFALRLLYLRMAGVEGLGLGDVKLAAAGAPLLQWAGLPMALLIAAIGGLLAVAGRSLRQRQWPGRTAEIPFGAFLAPAIWLAFVLERSFLGGS